MPEEKDRLYCPDCQRVAAFLCGRSTDRKYVCFDCLPAPDIDRYPGWREKEMLRRQRSAQAKSNFQRPRQSSPEEANATSEA